VKNKRESSSPVRPPGVEKTSRLGSRDPVEQRDKVMDGFMVDPQNQGRAGLSGSRVMSGDWRKLHRVREVCSGSPENHWVTRLSHKTEAEDSTRRCGHPGQSNRPRGAVRPPDQSNRPEGWSDCPGRYRREASKRRTRVEIARLVSRLCRLRSLGIRPMEKIRGLPNSPLRGLYP
jgi:hypothetical protein